MRKPHMLAKATLYLRRRVAGLAGRLPAITGLAAEACVAPKTMWKAVRVLAAEGGLTVVPGGGIFAGASLPPPASHQSPATGHCLPVRLPKAQYLAQRISAEILNGRYAPGSMLPSCKEMCQRYGACYQTIAAAVGLLTSERRVAPHRKGYRVRQNPAHRGRPVLVFVGRLAGTPGLVRATPMSPDLWAAVERERMRLEVDLDMVEFDVALGTSVTQTPGQALSERYRHRSVLGYIVSTLGLRPGELERMLLHLLETGKPVSVLCEGAEPAASPRLLAHPLVRFYQFAGGSLAGEIVADFLLDLGHRHVAFITPYANIEWSTSRMLGLQRAFERAGPACRLTVFDASIGDLWAHLLRVAPYRSLQRSVERFVSRTNRPYDGSQEPFPGTFTQHYMTSQFLKSHLEPCFRRALADHTITAWVAAHDMVGLVALGFLEGNGVRVPQEVSVVSYDDTIEAFGVGLSSYNFNVAAMAQAMLDHILRDARPRKAGAGVLEIPGTVMARRSSGQAR
jgi:DNA-binding LacI/PurR family transcriptional regulator/DNA-binding transcriptional regulator YhcF (GntR family)